MDLTQLEKRLLLEMVRDRMAEGAVGIPQLTALIEADEEQLRAWIVAYAEVLLPNLRRRLTNADNEVIELRKQVTALEAYLAA